MSKITIKKLKDLPWSKATATLFVIKRKLISRKARYDLYQVKIDTKLETRLIKSARDKIDKSNKITDYDYLTADQDQTLLNIDLSETDLEGILDQIQSSSAPAFIKTENDLIGSWAYIARVNFPKTDPLYSVRRVSDSWTTKRVRDKGVIMFKKSVLHDLGDKEVFRIDSKIDFYAHAGEVFICDKKAFEAAMNFRDGMEKNRDNIVKEFDKLKLFKNSQDVSDLVGNNMKRLRKLAQVNKSGYFRDKTFMTNLIRITRIEKWEIKFNQNNEILVDEESIDTVLVVLNNDRLKSMINKEDFDVDVKHKL